MTNTVAGLILFCVVSLECPSSSESIAGGTQCIYLFYLKAIQEHLLLHLDMKMLTVSAAPLRERSRKERKKLK